MCGIVGAVANQPIVNILINGLKKLEYRGYDSAGVAVLNVEKQLKCLRVMGKVRELENAMQKSAIEGHTGIAHTRWATHGTPSEMNAHPLLSSDEFALVHNGIIENHELIRHRLIKKGYVFSSETDTEAVVHLIHYHYSETQDFLLAVQHTVSELRGAYAFGILAKRHPDRLIAVRQGSPLVIGQGQGQNFIASDPLALLSLTQAFIYLEEGDLVDLTLNEIKIYDHHRALVTRATTVLSANHDVMERGEYRHFMKKEIMEQPSSITACMTSRVTRENVLGDIFGPKAAKVFQQAEHIQLVACGTSYHAAMVARYWIEGLVHLPCSVEIASEFRYRTIAPPKNSLYITLSQSGETADTLAALRFAKEHHHLSTLAICNVAGSTMTREADITFLTNAGIEIGVASTKAFTTQLTALFLLVLTLRQKRNLHSDLDVTLVQHLHQLPNTIQHILKQEEAIIHWAKSFANYQHAVFLGRGLLYPIALEAALKLKEISYIHAEGYPSGELKHGPLALVDAEMPVVMSIPDDEMLQKNLANLQEVRARGGKVFLLTDKSALIEELSLKKVNGILVPHTHHFLQPILFTIPQQLLAYQVAVLKGTDVDQPRNLAKSVTVE